MEQRVKRVVQLETEIIIAVENHEAAYAAVVVHPELSTAVAKLSGDFPTPLIPDLTALLVAFGYMASHTMDGSIRWVKKNTDSFCKAAERKLWEVLAPYIDDGSYITFGEEDGEVWAWVFAGRKLHDVDFSFYRVAVVKGLVMRRDYYIK